MQNKKILFLVGKITVDKTKLAKLIDSFTGPSVKIIVDRFSNLTFEVETGKIVIKVSGTDIKNFDLVYIRSISRRLSFMAGILAFYLKRNNIKLVNSRFEYSRALSDKLTSLVILGLNDLPVIPSFFCSVENIEENIDYLIEKFGFPIVVKETSKHHSAGIYVVREKEDFGKLPKETEGRTSQYLFQKFVPILKEYRILVLGNKAVSVQQMFRNLDDFKAKVNMDVDWHFEDVKSISEATRKIAVKAAKVLSMQVAGVDVLITKDDLKTMLIEVNSSPGFTYDTGISPEIFQLSKYLEKETLE
jgi:glutathione synthase/RimK-type ligase-like ATP-grasp enzyme